MKSHSGVQGCLVSHWNLLTISLALHSEVAVGEEQAFLVNTRGAGGQGQLDVRMTSPSRRPIPCKLEPGSGAEAQAVRYMPPEEGPYKVDITYDGHPVPGSPFAVEGVLPPDPSKVNIWKPVGSRSWGLVVEKMDVF